MAEEAFWAANFHGFSKLKKEKRCDAWYQGCVADFVHRKEDLLKHNFDTYKNALYNPEADCSIGGVSRALSPIKDSVTVIHGPVGCAVNNIFFAPSFFWSPQGIHTVVSTAMDQTDALLGSGIKLREVLLDVIERYKPGVIIVASTCATDIIGENIEEHCLSLEEETGVPTIYVSAPGFKWRLWSPVGDEAYIKIFDRMKKCDEREKNSVNILNVGAIQDSWNEGFTIASWMEELGLKVQTVGGFGQTYKEFTESFPKAELNLSRCTGFGYQALEYAAFKLGIEYLRLPKPMSIKFSTIWFREIGKFFGIEGRAEAFLQKELEKYGPRIERAKKKLEGKKMAILTGPGKNIAAAQLAYELGMKVVYLGPWKLNTTYHDFLKDWLDTTGQDPEIVAMPSKFEHEIECAKTKPDIIMALSEERPALIKLLGLVAQIDPCSQRNFIGIEGAARTAEDIVRAMENPFYQKYNKYVSKHPMFHTHCKKSYFEREIKKSLHKCGKR